jgi:hypothetical protein
LSEAPLLPSRESPDALHDSPSFTEGASSLRPGGLLINDRCLLSKYRSRGAPRRELDLGYDTVLLASRPGPIGMANALDCRVQALKCSEAARRASEPRVKTLLAEMAALWINLARELERTGTEVDDEALRHRSNIIRHKPRR